MFRCFVLCVFVMFYLSCLRQGAAPGLRTMRYCGGSSSDEGANGSLRVTRGLGCLKNMIIEEISHAKGPKEVKRSRRGAKSEPRTKRELKGIKKRQKGAKREPKREPKGRPFGEPNPSFCSFLLSGEKLYLLYQYFRIISNEFNLQSFYFESQSQLVRWKRRKE